MSGFYRPRRTSASVTRNSYARGIQEPRYGIQNVDYIASFFERDDPGEPMWALNLMKDREVADYADGTSIQGPVDLDLP